MTEQTFDIYFCGEIITGHEADAVHSAVGRIFSIGGDKLDHLFSGQPVRVKVGVDQETAIKYRVAFREAGALIQIVKSGEKPSPRSQPEQSPSESDSPSESGTLELLPPRSGDLSDCHKPVADFEMPSFDLISLAPEGTTIDDTPPVPAAQIDTGNLSMSAARSGSLEGVELKRAEGPIPDTRHLEIEER